VGPDKTIISSTVVPHVQAMFPDGAINKPIKVCPTLHLVYDKRALLLFLLLVLAMT